MKFSYCLPWLTALWALAAAGCGGLTGDLFDPPSKGPPQVEQPEDPGQGEEERLVEAERAAATFLRQRGVLVTVEPPERHVTSVNFTLKFQDQEVDEESLRQVAALYHVGTLNFADTKITDRQLHHLSGLTTMNSLVLGGTPVSDAGMVHLSGLPALIALHLPNTRVSDQGLELLARIRSLHILDLSGTRVTDEGLKHLLGLKKFRTPGRSPCWLLLTNNEITDEGLKHLEQMKGVGRLTIDRTRVTPEGVRRLKMAVPGLSVDPL